MSNPTPFAPGTIPFVLGVVIGLLGFPLESLELSLFIGIPLVAAGAVIFGAAVWRRLPP